MKLFLAFLLTMVVPSQVFANCQDRLSENGLYYSETGHLIDAARLNLWETQSNPIALAGEVTQKYSPDGRFFLRSGVNGEPWLIVSPATTQEAVLLRRLTQSQEVIPADFVSVFRANLPEKLCKTERNVETGAQKGYAQERNFVDANEFALFHADPLRRKQNPELSKVFHFNFLGDGEFCSNTAEIADPVGNSLTAMVYLGQSQVRITTSGEIYLQRGAEGVAQVFLPKPAYARSVDPDDAQKNRAKLNISSVEASLFHIGVDQDICVEFPAPTPTARVARGWLTRLFRIVPRHQAKAVRMARDGEWNPTVSEFHFQQLRNIKQSALVQLNWKRH